MPRIELIATVASASCKRRLSHGTAASMAFGVTSSSNE